jgi:23S rRNA (guanosine2251-2'-O)-methyltransferase
VIVYGRNAVREALRGRRRVERVWATKNASSEPWLAAGGRPVELGTSQEIERRCGSAEHQGVCAEVSEFIYTDPDELLGSPAGGLIVVLDQVQDPQNLGAICRTAECAGAAGVVIGERRSAQVTPAVCKASAGAVEHLPVVRVRNVADFLTAAKQAGHWCYGADAQAERRYDEPSYDQNPVLVLGSEGRGLRPRVAGQCDELVSIPLRGRIESLSVSAAAAILIYGLTGQDTSVTVPPGR